MTKKIRKKIFESKIYNAIIENSGKRYGKLPDAMISGIEKCGTTWLYSLLTQHTKIQNGLTKEVFYFDRHIDRSIDWYKGHWFDNSKLAIDGCPTYYRNKTTLQLIKTIVPKIKHIIILRDPIQRLESAWNMNLNRGWDQRLTFNDVIYDEYLNGEINEGYLHQSRYDDRIDDYENLFELDQLHVLFLEDLTQDTQNELNHIFEFLGLEPQKIKQIPPLNKGTHHRRFDPETKEFLKNYFEPHNMRLGQILDRELPYKF